MKAGTKRNLAANLAACAAAGVVLVEQPLPDGRRPGAGRASSGRSRSAPTKACTTAPRCAALAGKYDAVNIKLDKAGGLTEALAMAAEAERLGFTIMVGCMVATSLAMAPAMLLAQTGALRRSRRPAAARQGPAGRSALRGSLVYPPAAALWG